MHGHKNVKKIWKEQSNLWENQCIPWENSQLNAVQRLSEAISSFGVPKITWNISQTQFIV